MAAGVGDEGVTFYDAHGSSPLPPKKILASYLNRLNLPLSLLHSKQISSEECLRMVHSAHSCAIPTTNHSTGPEHRTGVSSLDITYIYKSLIRDRQLATPLQSNVLFAWAIHQLLGCQLDFLEASSPAGINKAVELVCVLIHLNGQGWLADASGGCSLLPHGDKHSLSPSGFLEPLLFEEGLEQVQDCGRFRITCLEESTTRSRKESDATDASGVPLVAHRMGDLQHPSLVLVGGHQHQCGSSMDAPGLPLNVPSHNERSPFTTGLQNESSPAMSTLDGVRLIAGQEVEKGPCMDAPGTCCGPSPNEHSSVESLVGPHMEPRSLASRGAREGGGMFPDNKKESPVIRSPVYAVQQWAPALDSAVCHPSDTNGQEGSWKEVYRVAMWPRSISDLEKAQHEHTVSLLYDERVVTRRRIQKEGGGRIVLREEELLVITDDGIVEAQVSVQSRERYWELLSAHCGILVPEDLRKPLPTARDSAMLQDRSIETGTSSNWRRSGIGSDVGSWVPLAPTSESENQSLVHATQEEDEGGMGYSSKEEFPCRKPNGSTDPDGESHAEFLVRSWWTMTQP